MSVTSKSEEVQKAKVRRTVKQGKYTLTVEELERRRKTSASDDESRT